MSCHCHPHNLVPAVTVSRLECYSSLVPGLPASAFPAQKPSALSFNMEVVKPRLCSKPPYSLHSYRVKATSPPHPSSPLELTANICSFCFRLTASFWFLECCGHGFDPGLICLLFPQVHGLPPHRFFGFFFRSLFKFHLG